MLQKKQNNSLVHTIGNTKDIYVQSKRVAGIAIAFAVFIFFRFYQFEERLVIGFDQTIHAWVIKDMLVDHKFPLVGMAAKGNSGVFIGPAYYYLLAGFYALTNLHPIAAGYSASIMSTLTAIVLFLTVKKMFSERIAIIALGITAFSYNVIFSDRLAGPVNLLPLTSILIFYLWYKILLGDIKVLPVLAAVIGFAFHLHVTAVFYIFISLACLPKLIKQKVRLKTLAISLGVFLLWFLPNIISNFIHNNQEAITVINFINQFYHGVHLQRILQLLPDAFIEFESILQLGSWSMLRYGFIPLFILLTWRFEERKKAQTVIYMTLLWYFIPWLVLSTFRGEISNYYFAITRAPSLIAIAYIINKALVSRKWLIICPVVVFIAVFAMKNSRIFFRTNDKNFIKQKAQARSYIDAEKRMDFKEGIAESYLYFYYRGFEMSQ